MIEFDPDMELEWEVGPDVDIQFKGERIRMSKRWTRVSVTTSGKDNYGYPSRWRLLKAAFSRPGKDIYLG